MATKEAIDMLWVLVSPALVFLMQAGFGCLETGATRSKNSINVAVKNLVDLTISCLIFYFVGYGLMFGASWLGLTGTDQFFFDSPNYKQQYFFLFQMVFCGTATTIVSGAVAERMTFSGYLAAAVLVSILIYPIFGHWVWNNGGFLKGIGFVDFAGSTVVHSIGAWVALSAIMIVGARNNRFNDDGTVNKIHGSNLPMSVLGAIILWFGWIGFNGGSTLTLDETVPQIILNTLLAGAAGGVTALFTSWPFRKRPECEPLVNGSLAGLVAITASCHAVSAPYAIFIGAVGGFCMLWCENLLIRLRLDDAVEVIPVHLAAGIWGTLAAGIFGKIEVLGTGLSRMEQIAAQISGILIACGWGMLLSYLLLRIVNYFVPLRVSAEDEFQGLNVAEHGATTEILDFFRTMDQQEKTGDYSLRVVEEPFTEIGQIAKKYNRVLESVERSRNEIKLQRDKTDQILKSLNEGLLVIDENGVVGNECSDVTKKMLGTENLEGHKFIDLILPKENSLDRQRIQSFIDSAFSLIIPEQFYDLLASVPASIHYKKGDETYIYSLGFVPQISKGNLQRIIAVMRDDTELEKLRNHIAFSYQQIARTLQKLQKNFSNEADRFGLQKYLDEISPLSEDLINKITNFTPDQVDGLFRELHTIKGGAKFFDLDFLKYFAHEAEMILRDLREGNLKPENINREKLVSDVKSMHENLKILSDFMKATDKGVKKFSEEEKWQFFVSALQNSAMKLAGILRKQVDVRVRSDHSFGDMDLAEMNKIFIHLIRNSLDHGIELPLQRKECGKKKKGRIHIHIRVVEDKTIEIIYSDDGAGINTEKVLSKAFKKGIIAEVPQKVNLTLLRDILIAPGFSSLDQANDVSGQGVGMDVVADSVRSPGGDLFLTKTDGTGVEFKLMIPLKEPAKLLQQPEKKVA